LRYDTFPLGFLRVTRSAAYPPRIQPFGSLTEEEANMKSAKEAILDKTTDVLEDSADIAKDVAKKTASVVADGAKVVKIAAVRGYEAAGDVVSLTGRQIRRKPVVATLSAIGVGFLVGFLIGRKSRS
jgi:ElaB/YqjD/DUF883 family membrane-anchored ribosome-binding protein